MIERFAIADELTCYYDRPAEPANVHVEARIPGRLDEAAVRAAVHAVLAAEPRIAARRAGKSAGTGRWRRSFYWEFPVAPAADPVVAVTYADQADLDLRRDAFLSRSPSLDVAPPLRFLLASGQGGDCLILNAHHACLDGLSCLRLLRQVAEAYDAPASEPPWPGPVRFGRHGEQVGRHGEQVGRHGEQVGRDGEQVGRDGEQVGRDGEQARPASRARPVRVGRPEAGRVARIAPGPGGVPDRAGYGAHLLSWDGLAGAGSLRPGDASVNDLLIAALMLTISEWNESRRPGRDRIRITMPVGDRAQASRGGHWANLSRLTTVTARVPPGTRPAALIEEIAAQTRHAKLHPGPQVGMASRGLVAAPVPVAVKHLLLRTALAVAGSFICDTSLVSNLGVVEGPAFGAWPGQVWFSTSAHMPRGLSLGAVTSGGRLRLTFRYRRALFSGADAAEFAGRYVKALDQFVGQEAARR